jgi:hypothetical protein
MSTRLTRGTILEVPLPADYQDQQCLPLVIMQPTADATNYMLKTTYATNGQPGTVDHAILADQANTVQWLNIANLPTVFPPAPHAPTHITGGNDIIPFASIPPNAKSGLCPPGTGQVTDYLGGDISFHALPAIFRFRAEGPVTIDPSFTSGAVLFTAVVANPAPGVYMIDMPYMYAASQTSPPVGMVHVDVWDPTIPGWIQVTSSTDISVMNAKDVLLRPILLSSAITRVFTAPANGLTFRLVLDQPNGTAAFFQCGCSFLATTLQTLP